MFALVCAAVSVYLLPERFVGPVMRRVSAIVARFLSVAGRLPSEMPDRSAELKAILARIQWESENLRRMKEGVDFLGSVFDVYRWRPARVVLRGDASDLRRSIILTAGSRNGVDVGAPVVWGEPGTGAVLVGVVRQVYGWASRAAVVGDPTLAVAVETPSGVRGLVVSQEGALLLRYIEGGEPRDGEAVLTSGRLGRLPAGLFVGTVRAEKMGDGVRFLVVQPFKPEETPFVMVGVLR